MFSSAGKSYIFSNPFLGPVHVLMSSYLNAGVHKILIVPLTVLQEASRHTRMPLRGPSCWMLSVIHKHVLEKQRSLPRKPMMRKSMSLSCCFARPHTSLHANSG